MTSRWRALAPGLVAALLVVAAGCSSGDDDEAAGEAADATTTTVDALEQVVLPGLPGNPAPTTAPPAGAPTTSVAPGPGSTSTTAAPTPVPTSAPVPTSTTTTAPPPSSSTTTAPPSRTGLPFGPTILVDDGESSSTFQWEMATFEPTSQGTVSVEWLIDGTSESVSLVDDDFDEMLVRIGEQYWATNQAGEIVAVDATTYGQRRQAYLDETFATSIGQVMSPSELDGPGRYVVSTGDQAVIGAVLGGQPLAGSTMQGTIDVDTAGRLVGWDLEVTQPGPAGQATPTTFSLTGSIMAGVNTPITPP